MASFSCFTAIHLVSRCRKETAMQQHSFNSFFRRS